MSKIWFEIIGAVAVMVLVSFIGYGAYRFYFTKPTPIVQTVYVQSGGTLNQQVPREDKAKKQHLITGIAANKDAILGTIAWMW